MTRPEENDVLYNAVFNTVKLDLHGQKPVNNDDDSPKHKIKLYSKSPPNPKANSQLLYRPLIALIST